METQNELVGGECLHIMIKSVDISLPWIAIQVCDSDKKSIIIGWTGHNHLGRVKGSIFPCGSCVCRERINYVRKGRLIFIMSLIEFRFTCFSALSVT